MSTVKDSAAEQFNAGDNVYVTSLRDDLTRAVVTRVTKTQAIIDRGRYEQRFNRVTGRLIGEGAWQSTRIARPSERLDAEWHAVLVKKAATRLMHAASKDDPAAIREAYAGWDLLEKGNTE